MIGWVKRLSGRSSVTLLAVVLAFLSIVDIGTKALFTQLQRIREARLLGCSWLEAVAVARVPVISGGATWLNDLKNNLLDDAAGNSIRPQTATSTVTGQAIDLQQADGECFAALQVGAVSGTTPTLDVKVQESDTSGGTYTDIAGATLTQVVASNKSQIINFKRSKRFCRLVGTIAGTTPSYAFAGQLYGMKKSVV